GREGGPGSGAPTAGKEEDIGRDVLETRPGDRAETETSGEDISSLVVQRVVGRALRLGDEDRRIRAKKAGVGCGGSREAHALSRVEKVVGRIVGNRDWHAD